MSTFDATMAMTSMIGALIFCLMSCHLCENWNFYSQAAKEKIALANIFVGLVTVNAFGYTMIRMQFTAVDQSQFAINVTACACGVLEIAGILLVMMSLNEFRVFRHQEG